MAMPLILKLLTAATLVVPVICLVSLFPSQSINIFGRQMTTREWWSSGAGVVMVAVGALIVVAALLMLRRSRYGRPTYVAGWLAMSASVPVVAHLTGTHPSTELASLIWNLVLTVSIGLYLYNSSAARDYFATKPLLRGQQ